MSMVCPSCGGYFDQQLDCPDCAVRLQFSSNAPRMGRRLVNPGEGWQYTTLGRVLIGLLLAQGLALGIRMFVDAGMLQTAAVIGEGGWSSLQGILVMQGLFALSLLIASGLAGAGQYRGFLVGALIGLFNGVILLALQNMAGQQLNEVVLYGQPLIHIVVGMFGGLIGSLIWRPLPVIQLAPAGKKEAKRPARRKTPLAGPIAWFRVLIGSAVVVAGVLSPQFILDLLIYHSENHLRITSHFQSKVVLWELIGLAVFFGACIAGFNTFNGLKQGLCVGILSCFVVVSYQLNMGLIVEEIVFTGFVILAVSMLGSWFSSKLFPPVVSVRRRTFSEPA